MIRWPCLVDDANINACPISHSAVTMRLALLQCAPSQRSLLAGLDHLEAAAREAAALDADILITPEMFLSGYNIGADAVRACAEPADGTAGSTAAEIARTHNIGLLYGYPELDVTGSVYNSVRLIDADGHALANYRKTHLYGVVDAAQFRPGDTLSEIVTYRDWRIGLAICYDIEFPEVARSYALAGAELLLVPTANMAPFDSIPLRIVPARAEENAVFVAYVNFVGVESDFAYVGLSCICSPDGKDIVRGGTKEEIICGDIEHDRLEEVRAMSTHLDDRRPSLYSKTILAPTQDQGGD